MRNPDRQRKFRFKQFEVSNWRSAMKVGTDGVLLGAWSFGDISSDAKIKVLDIGCGTGILSLMMAQRFGNADIRAIDIDDAAADESHENFEASVWSDRLDAKCVNLADYSLLPDEGCYDCIICNPPFFTNGALSPDEERRMARHETELTLELLFRKAGELLGDNGRIAIVTAAEHCERVSFLAALNGFRVTHRCMVKTKETKLARRVMCEAIKTGGEVQELNKGCKDDVLIIHEAGGAFSERYSQLVSPYYINF